MVTPASKRRAASVMVTDFRRSQSRSCRLVGLQRSSYRYRSRRPGDGELREKLRELAHRRPRFGYRRLGIFLRREGYRINHKKLLRLYRCEGLVLLRKRPKKRLWRRPKPLLPATRPNERWSMDFVQDGLESGRRFRILTIVDDYTREWKAAVVDTSIGGVRIVRLLEEIAESTGLPTVIVSDNGPEFTSRAFLSWAERRGIDLRFIQPGKPTQNAFVESFNGKFREECLDTHWFTTMDDARREIEMWRADYNDVRPHSSLKDRTPSEFTAAHREAAA
jgi:putative transposase